MRSFFVVAGLMMSMVGCASEPKEDSGASSASDALSAGSAYTAVTTARTFRSMMSVPCGRTLTLTGTGDNAGTFVYDVKPCGGESDPALRQPAHATGTFKISSDLASSIADFVTLCYAGKPTILLTPGAGSNVGELTFVIGIPVATGNILLVDEHDNTMFHLASEDAPGTIEASDDEAEAEYKQ